MMSSPVYTEPELSIVILDYAKPIESYMCLDSIKKHVKFPHKVIFCDNGSQEDYPVQFLRKGLIDQLIINRESLGLGVGTRDVINASFSSYFLYLQNDQYIGRDFTIEEFESIKKNLGTKLGDKIVLSISLAGVICDQDTFSERAFVMRTEDYKSLEREVPLGYWGAGRFHDGPWRERQLQDFYKEHNFLHYTGWPTAVIDNGVYATRDMGDGGVFCHRTDTKACWVIVPPKVKNPAYPKMNDEEFNLAMKNEWPDGRIPEAEIKDSFHCWGDTVLAKRETDYIKDLRARFKGKNV
jgi:hypothetical protein